MIKKTPSMNAEFELPADWRGKIMTSIRHLIQQADPEITEEVKYRTASNPNGVLVWYKKGMLLTGEVYKQHLRLSFAKGPLLKDNDPQHLINSHRAIIVKEEDALEEEAFQDLIRAAVELNTTSKK